jgi:hypothetical protein
MNHRRLFIDGLAAWTPTLTDWEQLALALRSQNQPLADAAPQRPSPSLLAANERRRAPDSVLMALQVAQEAVAASGHDAAGLASVFASAHGDLPITDALCRTLAANPLALSPTRFHHSVHNAASGYWAIASHSRAASTALSAFTHSFAAGLLEAACQCAANGQPVLLVACDTQATGPLASVNRSRGWLALALVLASSPGPASTWTLDWQLGAPALAQPLRSPSAQQLAQNASGDALPLLQALAGGEAAAMALPLGPALALQVMLQPWLPAGA